MRPSAPTPERMPFIDALKAVGSQLIVLHHLAFHGPMSAWLACNLAGAAFHHGVEQRLGRLGRSGARR